MVVRIKKIFFILIILIQLGGNVMAGELSVNDKLEIIDVMNNYAKGIDTKNYDLFRSIFEKDVEVEIIYDSGFRSGEPVSFEGLDEVVANDSLFVHGDQTVDLLIMYFPDEKIHLVNFDMKGVLEVLDNICPVVHLITCV